MRVFRLGLAIVTCVGAFAVASARADNTCGPTLLGSSGNAGGYTSTINANTITAIEAGKETYFSCAIDTSTNGTHFRRYAPKIRYVSGGSGYVSWESPYAANSYGGCDVSSGNCSSVDAGSSGGTCALGWKIYKTDCTGAWGGNVPSTWSTTNKTAAFGVSGATATFTSPGSGQQGVRSATALTGKVVFAVTKTATVGGYLTAVGITPSTSTLAQYLGSGYDTIFVNLDTTYGGIVGLATVGGIATLPYTDAAGNEIVIAADMANKLAWFSIDGSDWNANSSADPATGVGGLSFASITASSFYIGASIDGSAASNSFVIGTPTTKAVPAGFSAP